MRLDRDKQVVLLLTAHFGTAPKDAPKPLGPKEWGDFARWLNAAGHRPGALLDNSEGNTLEGWGHPKITSDRIQRLLERGGAMGVALEKWERAGIWVMTRADTDYPSRLKRRLGSSAPPVLFGCGGRELLDRGGVAIVGSRKATEEDLKFTRQLAVRIGQDSLSVVSGGARGVDEAAMLGALDAESTVIGVLADSLVKAATSSKYRKALRSKDLVLVSPFKPDGRFQVGNAMARNKYIYCLADAGVVIACEEGSGGTWAGATETLRNSWVPVWVKTGAGAASGNSKLQEKGAQSLPDVEFAPTQLISGEKPAEAKAENRRYAETPEPTEPAEGNSSSAETVELPETGSDVRHEISFYGLFLQKFERHFSNQSGSIKEIKELLNLEAAQVKNWLAQAETEGKLVKVKKSPLRYQWVTESADQTTLF